VRGAFDQPRADARRLTLGSRVENSFSGEDVDFLMRAAGQIAIAIENALAYREIAEFKEQARTGKTVFGR